MSAWYSSSSRRLDSKPSSEFSSHRVSGLDMPIGSAHASGKLGSVTGSVHAQQIERRGSGHWCRRSSGNIN
jgi:hypothetical protein